jgi:putative aldouronate transport system permease protein
LSATISGRRAELISGSRPPQERVRRQASLWRRMMRERWMYAFIVPGFLFFVVFAYLPLFGNVVAFQNYSPFLGFRGSPWVGFANFTALFSDPDFLTALRNTVVISLLQIVFAFPAPIALALLLNSLISERLKRLVQSIVYLPHFISWVIVVSIWQEVLGGAGGMATLLSKLGIHSVNIMSNPDTFKILVTSQVVWKETGWGTIIFFAAISAVAAELYESAACDGAGSFRQMWHVTLPAIVPVTMLLLILRLGSVFSVGFEQLILQQNAVGPHAAQVIDTFAYYRGVLGGDWGLSAAAGLFKGVIGTLLVIGANKLAKRSGAEGLF